MNYFDNKKLKSTFQRALLVIAAIALSGVVYFFVYVNAKRNAAALEQNEAYAAPATTPELFGARESAVLSALENAGVQYAYENGHYDVSINDVSISDGGIYTTGEMELTKRDGYVVGLTLKLSAIERPEAPKNTTNNAIIGEYEIKLEEYTINLKGRQQLLHSALSAVTGIIDQSGELPVPKLYEWEAEVEYLDSSDPLFSDTFGRYYFAASISGTGVLTVSLVG